MEDCREAEGALQQRRGALGPAQATHSYLLIRFRKSTAPQNRQLFVHDFALEYYVDGFVGELTSKNNQFCGRVPRG